MQRPRPYGVPIIAGWAGYSAPAVAVGILTLFLMGVTYCLVVPGRPRSYAKAASAVIVTVLCLAYLYLAVDHVDDVLLGAVLGVAIPVTAFRFFTPNEVFPVTYRRGNTAHVDVTGRRGEAIRRGVRDQLGLTVTEIMPVGLESSAGSTPLRLRVEGSADEYLFAKLYTKGHVRADRWYKLWRTILYGSLEDEHPFQTVRRLAEYEDYALRLLQDAGIGVARPYGIVEITPEREYLVATEYFDGAVEIGDADVDDQLIDQGLLLIRSLWDAGIAHRDIKPGNLMVRAGQLLLIDVMFVQVRPSPWRQAVNLGNMMLVLAVRTDPGRVYQRALRYFTEAELARGVRRHPRGSQPDAAARFHETRSPRPARRVPQARPAAAANRAAALERPAGDPGRGNARHLRRAGHFRHRLAAADQQPESARARLRHRPRDDPGRPGRSLGSLPALHRGAPVRLDCGQRRDRQPESHLLAGLRSSRAGRGDDHPDRRLRHLGRPADPLRPPGDPPVRAPGDPGPAILRRSLLHLPRRLRDLPVPLHPRRVPGPGRRSRQRARVRAAVGPGRLCPAHRGPGLVRAGCGMPRMRWPAAAPEEHPLLASPRRAALLTAGVVALTAVVFALVAGHGTLARIQRVDDAWLRLMVSGRTPALTVIAKIFNVLGLVYVTLPVRIAVAGFLALRRRWWHLAAFTAAVVASEVLIGPLKGIYDRARPPGSLVATSGASFPSGHAIAASVTAVAAVIALVPPGRRRTLWGAAAVAFSILMGLSRAYLGAHWLSDATAGILLGTSCALLTALVTGLLQRRQQEHRVRRPHGTPGLATAAPPDHAGRGWRRT